ncbi:uncharacterized protein THITE_2088950 [Thermothielavioides terrestris NRRL 8126]|uniref:2EXR domain-containing protein n=1 Tax=Thermothielavioides terrestris (strain ATCC 38088 / NRRL 8126) TaxID=578455 RepID=G2R5H1_THETT|nr:uncharacterized protein THITE_2088950 [Thermothielavioides terrestris NRRL 8126]AEO67462.1 hypothetical protein THITE_2088950 [Thermothielavioides terrestris NRRL 8126]
MAQQEFHLFPRLPPELREMIWAESLEPRVVGVNPVHKLRPRAGKSKISWRIRAPMPALFSVSVEARRVAMPLYKKLYFACPAAVRGVAPPVVFVYFHPELDVLSQDFEAIVVWPPMGVNRIRRPGILARVSLPGNFDDVVQPIAPPVPRGRFDPLRDLRHVNLDIHVLRSSLTHLAMQTLPLTRDFVHSVLSGPGSVHIQTVTVRITDGLGAALNSWPRVYRIVRSPAIHPGTTLVYSDMHAKLLHPNKCGIDPSFPKFRYALENDGVVIAKPRPSTWAAFRVIDPRSPYSEFDDDGGQWSGPVQELLWQTMLYDGMKSNDNSVATWLDRVLGAPDWMHACISPWGICGVHYGMGDAKPFRHLTDPMLWNWP